MAKIARGYRVDRVAGACYAPPTSCTPVFGVVPFVRNHSHRVRPCGEVRCGIVHPSCSAAASKTNSGASASFTDGVRHHHPGTRPTGYHGPKRPDTE